MNRSQKNPVTMKNGRFATFQDLLRHMVNEHGMARVCNQMAVSRSTIAHWLHTKSDKNLDRYRDRVLKSVLTCAKRDFDYQDSQLPLDVLRKLNLKRSTVFLCHGKEDKESVRELYTGLSKTGYDPWLDEIDLKPGQDWRTEIDSAIKKSIAIVICLSSTSVSKTGFVQKEIKIALDAADERPEGTIYIIPARLEECQVPLRLNHLHYTNLYEEGGYEALLGSLDNACNFDAKYFG